MNCAYCGTSWKESASYPGTCAHCGAAKPQAETIQKYGPFFYEGMVVYSLHDACGDFYEFVFYKGVDLIGVVKVSRETIIRELIPGSDMMSYVMERLREEQSAINLSA